MKIGCCMPGNFTLPDSAFPELGETLRALVDGSRFLREAGYDYLEFNVPALVNLSESRFKQKFKQATGIPPAEFTVREKIRESQTLLKDPARTVTSIAMELGFSSSQHFSVLFRKYTGLSPVQYRQNHEFVS